MSEELQQALDEEAAQPKQTVLEARQKHGASDHILQFFSYSHLPGPLQAISEPFASLAARIVEVTPRNPERTVALRKLLEAKDAAVRAHLAK